MAAELKRERLTKFINAAISPSEKGQLEAYCKETGYKKSEVVRHALTLFLEANSRKSKEIDEKSKVEQPELEGELHGSLL